MAKLPDHPPSSTPGNQVIQPIQSIQSTPQLPIFESVDQWLESLKLTTYLPVLIEAGFDSLLACQELDERDFVHLPMVKPGHRKVLIRAATLLRESNQNQPFGPSPEKAQPSPPIAPVIKPPSAPPSAPIPKPQSSIPAHPRHAPFDPSQMQTSPVSSSHVSPKSSYPPSKTSPSPTSNAPRPIPSSKESIKPIEPPKSTSPTQPFNLNSSRNFDDDFPILDSTFDFAYSPTSDVPDASRSRIRERSSTPLPSLNLFLPSDPPPSSSPSTSPLPSHAPHVEPPSDPIVPSIPLTPLEEEMKIKLDDLKLTITDAFINANSDSRALNPPNSDIVDVQLFEATTSDTWIMSCNVQFDEISTKFHVVFKIVKTLSTNRSKITVASCTCDHPRWCCHIVSFMRYVQGLLSGTGRIVQYSRKKISHSTGSLQVEKSRLDSTLSRSVESFDLTRNSSSVISLEDSTSTQNFRKRKDFNLKIQEADIPVPKSPSWAILYALHILEGRGTWNNIIDIGNQNIEGADMDSLIRKGCVLKNSRDPIEMYRLTEYGRQMAARIYEIAENVQVENQVESLTSVTQVTNEISADSTPVIPQTPLRPNDDIIIVVDNREIQDRNHRKNHGNIVRGLDYRKVRSENRSLKLGDFMWIAKTDTCERVLNFIVERKKISDLLESLEDGRYQVSSNEFQLST
eukprot:TRINITY_DN932_c0_g2_i1.p1 TRINITY_DN932_c0_g2~~TRINITY_DN932_c0_g2_i1.p1  ORF type:complete len:761 (-),score=248.68 TRINITY_DN932_c0_g2_i1:678-2729(-)